jgi:SAM-dependent methyltransferase
MTPSKAMSVVAAYEQRARFARAETAAVRRPRLLAAVLDSATHVTEIPCGAGNFLTAYARANVAVTLVDASPAMLAAAVEHAATTGADVTRTFPILSYLDDLPQLSDVDLVVVPNAALNQLACQTPLIDLLAHLRTLLRCGATVLAQVACTHPVDTTDTATFYDPTLPHGTWFTDRRFLPASAGGAVARRRRQHREGNRLRIEFDYRDPTGTCLHATEVELTLFTAPELVEAFEATGFTHVRHHPGHTRLSEVLAVADGARR